jgi:uncharacterized phiE125 gp8 family phage protein
MRTTLVVTTEPTAEPVSIEQVKRHCRIDSNADDELLTGYLTAARVMAEGYLSRALLTQTLLWTVQPSSERRGGRDRSRLHGTLELPRAPVQSIESVATLDVWGNATTIPAAVLPVPPLTEIIGYVADLSLEPSTLFIGGETPLSGGFALRFTRLQYLQVSMVAGYEDTTGILPTTIQAIMMTTAFLYEHRGDSAVAMPDAAQWLLDRQRLQFLGG